MKTLFVKELRCSQKYPVQWSEEEDVSVAAIKSVAAEAFDIPVNEQVIVFGGRILKDGTSLVDYNVKEGSTIHVLRKAVSPERSDEAVEMESLEGHADAQFENRQQIIEELKIELLQGLQCLTKVHYDSDLSTQCAMLMKVAEVVHHPRLLQEVLLSGDSGILDADSRALAMDPNMANRTRDPAFVRRMLEGNSALVEALRRHLYMWNVYHDGTNGPILFGPNATEEADDVDGATASEELEQAPDQVDTNAVVASASPGSSISSSHLATALARAQGQSSLSSVSSTSSGTSQLGILPLGLQSSSPDGSLQPVLSRQQSNNSRTDHESAITTGTFISSAALSQALAGAMEASETPGTQWAQQLQQIQEFGVWDQAACIHALEETGGDVEAAVELLINQGIM